jgi:hypothetical protein
MLWSWKGGRPQREALGQGPRRIFVRRTSNSASHAFLPRRLTDYPFWIY